MIRIKDTWDKVTDPKIHQLAALALKEANISPVGDIYIYPFNEAYPSARIQIETILSEILGEKINLDVYDHHDNPNAELAEKIRDLIRSVPIPNIRIATENKAFSNYTSHMVLREDWRHSAQFNDLIKELGIDYDEDDKDGFFITTEHHLRRAGFTIENGQAKRPAGIALG